MVKKLLHTRYRVNDLDRAVSFYRDVLGCKEIRRSESPRGSKLAFLAVPNSEEQIELTYYPASGPVKVQPDLTHLAFEVEDMDAFSKHATAHGFPLTDGPTRTSTGEVIAFIDAPDGYEIELICEKSS